MSRQRLRPRIPTCYLVIVKDPHGEAYLKIYLLNNIPLIFLIFLIDLLFTDRFN